MRELTIGNNYHGFVVTDVIAIEELLGKAYVMRHEATRARALWLACDDENKSFAIAFKTPPANDTVAARIARLVQRNDARAERTFSADMLTRMATRLPR